ncbi:type VI secretion system-associated FHA domain protein TagH [Emcibacter sp. SYSU 3D8]|uniref:type VI secretion system-associated FHA domain protein TagH n=1 Tax=Emcibacter sp. SYSU 3D8 TaxID=3133969 RepID=UPI0031FF16BF
MKLRLTRPGDDGDIVEDERTLRSGSLVIGRAPDCDWVLVDRARLLSRQHCEISLEGDRIHVTDKSSNGIFLNGDTMRLERGRAIEVEHEDQLRIGEYQLSILVEEGDLDTDTAPGDRETFHPDNPFGEPEPEPVAAPATKPAAALADIPRDGALAAFMDGAQLDLATMRGAEPAAVLKRAGRLYRQIIGHVHDLLRDRSAVKAQFRAEQTMVTPSNANPFKSLMPDELAVRLLRSDQKGYLASEEAVEATFRDVKRHQLAVLSGMHRALVGLVNRLNPDEIEELLGKRSTMSIVTAGGKKAAAWDTYRAYFEQLERDIADLDRSSFMADFRRGYEDRLRQLQNADL